MSSEMMTSASGLPAVEGSSVEPTSLSRRGFLQCGVVVAGVGLLAACGGSPAPQPATPGSSGVPVPLVPVDEVPVGGAVTVPTSDGPVVVAQPEAGRVVAFSAVCTHQGCTVAPSTVRAEELHCPCHGSIFAAATGENLGGPAPSPLPAIPVTVVDGEVIAG